MQEGDDQGWPQSFKDCVGGVRSTMGEAELKRSEDLFFGHEEFGMLTYTPQCPCLLTGVMMVLGVGVGWEVFSAHPTADCQPNLICSHFHFPGAQ